MFSAVLSTNSDVFHSNNFFFFFNLYNVFTIAFSEFIAIVGKNVTSNPLRKRLPLIPDMFL